MLEKHHNFFQYIYTMKTFADPIHEIAALVPEICTVLDKSDGWGWGTQSYRVLLQSVV